MLQHKVGVGRYQEEVQEGTDWFWVDLQVLKGEGREYWQGLFVFAGVDLECGVGQKCEVAEVFPAGWGFADLFGNEFGQIIQKFISPLRTENILTDIFAVLFLKPSLVLLKLAELIDKILDDILHKQGEYPSGERWEVDLFALPFQNRLVIFPTLLGSIYKISEGSFFEFLEFAS